MQKNYESKSIGKKIATWGVIGITGLIGLISGGCATAQIPQTEEERVKSYIKHYNLAFPNDKLCLCGSKDRNPEIQEFFNRACKEAIIKYGETPRNDYHTQGERIYKIINADMTDILYDHKSQILTFSKKNFPERYAVTLPTLEVYEHVGNSEWGYNSFMTKGKKNRREIVKIIDFMNQKEREARLIQNNNNNQNNSDTVMDRATGNMMGNLSTQGLMKFFNDYSK